MKMYKNPLILPSDKHNTSDPFIAYCNEYYYHIYNGVDGIYISKFKEFCDIENGEIINVFPVENGKGVEWYAPELHRIGDSWYIYVSPDYGDDLHSMTVLKLQGETPMGKYENLGVVHGLEGEWTIDGTVFEFDNRLWFIWTFGSELYMQEMISPNALNVKSKRILLTKAELPFETITEIKVNEGPAVLKKGDKIHVIYSANDSHFDTYCLGRITFVGGDILDINNWEKCPESVFKMSESVFGPGHCSFTTADNGDSCHDYIVFHANIESGSDWPGRCVFIQKFEWDENDNPIFGEPKVGNAI